MGGGAWGCDGESPDRPCHMSPWSKSVLGWLEPAIATGTRKTYTFQPSAMAADALALPPEGEVWNPFSEYFMVQNRQKVRMDEVSPGEGLVIWHVTARLGRLAIEGDTISLGPYRVTVIEVGRRRIERLRIEPEPEA